MDLKNENLQSKDSRLVTANNKITKADIIYIIIILFVLALITLFTTGLSIWGGPYVIIIFIPLIFACFSKIVSILNKKNIFKRWNKYVYVIIISIICAIIIDSFAIFFYYFPSSSTKSEVLYYLSENYDGDFIISNRQKALVKNYCISDQGKNVRGNITTVYRSDNPEIVFRVYDYFRWGTEICDNTMIDDYLYTIISQNLTMLKTIVPSLKVIEDSDHNAILNLYFEDKEDLDKIINQGYQLINKLTEIDIYNNDLYDSYIKFQYYNPKTNTYEEVRNFWIPLYDGVLSERETIINIINKIDNM